VSSQRSQEMIMAATPSAQPRFWRRRHHPVGYGDGGVAQCSRPSGQAPHRIWRRRRGCIRHPTGEAAKTPLQAPRRGAEAPARSSRSRSSHWGEINWATLGGDGDEQRRNRQIATVKWKSLTRQTKCPTWRRRSSPELAGIERRSRRRFAVAREERIRVRASERE
jgi:hypothetical protein